MIHEIEVTLDGRPVSSCQFKLLGQGDRGEDHKVIDSGRSNYLGKLRVDSTDIPADQLLLLIRASGSYSYIQLLSAVTGTVALTPADYYAPIAWWQQFLGFSREPERGRGIRIGVIDSGCEPHPALNNIRSYGLKQLPFSEEDDIPEFRYELDPTPIDPAGHGTHVCGILNALPTEETPFCGICPGAEIYSFKILEYETGDDLFATQLGSAISTLVEDIGVDLINLSIELDPSLDQHQQMIVNHFIERATERGVPLVCAAGNQARENLHFLAEHPDSIAVASMGQANGIPANALALQHQPKPWENALRFSNPTTGENYFLAKTSNRGGQQIAAPGVAIFSTTSRSYLQDSRHPWLEFSGTSMATPMVTGILSQVLHLHRSELDSLRQLKRIEKFKALLSKRLSNPFIFQSGSIPEYIQGFACLNPDFWNV